MQAGMFAVKSMLGFNKWAAHPALGGFSQARDRGGVARNAKRLHGVLPPVARLRLAAVAVAAAAGGLARLRVLRRLHSQAGA